jgi:glutamine synthetase
VLAGVAHGIEQALDPGPPVTGDGYEQTTVPALPNNWPSALALLDGSAFARSAFGDRFVDVYTAVKRTESKRYFGEIPRQDYDWYLQHV